MSCAKCFEIMLVFHLKIACDFLGQVKLRQTEYFFIFSLSLLPCKQSILFHDGLGRWGKGLLKSYESLNAHNFCYMVFRTKNTLWIYYFLMKKGITTLGREASVSNCMNSIVRRGMVRLKDVLALLACES